MGPWDLSCLWTLDTRQAVPPSCAAHHVPRAGLCGGALVSAEGVPGERGGG